jgi:hypothetical protein
MCDCAAGAHRSGDNGCFRKHRIRGTFLARGLDM